MSEKACWKRMAVGLVMKTWISPNSGPGVAWRTVKSCLPVPLRLTPGLADAPAVPPFPQTWASSWVWSVSLPLPHSCCPIAFRLSECRVALQDACHSACQESRAVHCNTATELLSFFGNTVYALVSWFVCIGLGAHTTYTIYNRAGQSPLWEGREISCVLSNKAKFRKWLFRYRVCVCVCAHVCMCVCVPMCVCACCRV